MILMNDDQNEMLPPIQPEEELSLGDDIEVDDGFFDDEIDVVRAEFLSDSNEPAISFNNCQLYVNMACLKKLPEIDYVQLLINKTKNQLALRPCKEDDRDAFLWRTINRKSGKRQPKYITARIFSGMLFEHAGWDMKCRYRLIGKVKIARGIKLVVFDLGAYKAFEKKSADSESTQSSRRGCFPSDWKDSFGMPIEEHDNSLEISTFKDAAVMQVLTQSRSEPEETTEEESDG